jgi:hypothetical protein
MLPVVLATMAAAGLVVRGAGQPFPGAITGSVAGAILTLMVGLWWFRALRRARARIAGGRAAAAVHA